MALVAAGLGLGAPVPALSQSALGLKGTVDADEPPAGQLNETSLEASPIEAAPPEPRRRRAEVDPYAPQGIGNAGIRFYPSITAGTVHSSNVTNANSNPESDIGLRLRPELRAESNWIRHSLNAGVSGDFTRYRDHEELSTGTLNVFQRLRLDVRKHTTANIETSYALDDGGDTDPTEHTLSGSAALTQDFGAVTATLKAGCPIICSATRHLSA